MYNKKIKEQTIEQLKEFKERVMAQVQEIDNSIERLEKAETDLEVMTAIGNNLNTMMNLANKE